MHPKMKSPTMSDDHTDGILPMAGRTPAEELGIQFPNCDTLIYFFSLKKKPSLVLGSNYRKGCAVAWGYYVWNHWL